MLFVPTLLMLAASSQPALLLLCPGAPYWLDPGKRSLPLLLVQLPDR
jgi:hypothetical protein